jgi:hypothetical protein
MQSCAEAGDHEFKASLGLKKKKKKKKKEIKEKRRHRIGSSVLTV